MITIEIHDQEVTAAFNRLLAANRDLTPAMRAIGERLTETTKRRFASSTGPDGKRWAPNTDATLRAMLHRGKGSFTKKTGALSAKGGRVLAAKKPLIGVSKALSTTINYRAGATNVAIGSPMEYAATHQFGVLKGALGRTKRGAPIPWGNIPARPFLGVSQADKTDILEVLQAHLLGGA